MRIRYIARFYNVNGYEQKRHLAQMEQRNAPQGEWSVIAPAEEYVRASHVICRCTSPVDACASYASCMQTMGLHVSRAT